MGFEDELKWIVANGKNEGANWMNSCYQLSTREFNTLFGCDAFGNPQPHPVYLEWPQMALPIFEDPELVKSTREQPGGSWLDVISFREAIQFVLKNRWQGILVSSRTDKYFLDYDLLQKLS